MDTYLPLIQTIVGGLLAVTGGFLANLLLQRRNRAQEVRDFKRQKLEALYEHSSALEASVGQFVVFWATFAATKGNVPPSEDGRAALEKLKLIALFYFPELSSEVRGLEEAFDRFHASVSRYAEAVLEKRAAVPELFRETVNDPAETIRQARRSLIDAAARVARKYV